MSFVMNVVFPAVTIVNQAMICRTGKLQQALTQFIFILLFDVSFSHNHAAEVVQSTTSCCKSFSICSKVPYGYVMRVILTGYDFYFIFRSTIEHRF